LLYGLWNIILRNCVCTYASESIEEVELQVASIKKQTTNTCRDCGQSFRGHTGAYRCPECRKKQQKYKEMREKMRRSLPYYLKTDI
jgi:Zn finger protein HypA/HybF involved in hydrogenase expression